MLKATTDIWLAWFLVDNGHNVVDVKKEGKRGTWVFEMTEEQWKDLKLQFGKSEHTKIKFGHQRMMDLVC